MTTLLFISLSRKIKLKWWIWVVTIMTGASNSRATELPPLRSAVQVTQLNPAMADTTARPPEAASPPPPLSPDPQNHNIPFLLQRRPVSHHWYWQHTGSSEVISNDSHLTPTQTPARSSRLTHVSPGPFLTEEPASLCRSRSGPLRLCEGLNWVLLIQALVKSPWLDFYRTILKAIGRSCTDDGNLKDLDVAQQIADCGCVWRAGCHSVRKTVLEAASYHLRVYVFHHSTLGERLRWRIKGKIRINK